jgi:hypothetical protein
MRWHLSNDRPWPGFEGFLKSHVPSVFTNQTIMHHFSQTAFKARNTGPMQPRIGVAASIMQIRTWGMDPQIWVDRLEGQAALFSPKAKVIVVNKRIVQTFENAPTKQAYKDALEMLMLHELLHWTIDQINGTNKHAADHSDPVYAFEKAVYADADVRDMTLNKMDR